MSGSSYCFLTHIQVSQETGQVVWYSRLFKNFPQFFEIHKVKCLGRVNKAEVVVFLIFSSFFDDPTDVGNLISCSSPTSQLKSINSLALSLFNGSTLISIHDYWKKHSFDYTDLC